MLPILLHGDAAFAGQGVVAETLAMSDITGYRVGGTIHLIINNQIGFTTAPEFARSSIYCSDVAKTVQAPIFHVNGDDPEACVRVARLAFEYRQRFHKDVVIDMWCYRRHGHNEGDDPSYTQPLMYQAIAEHRSVRKLYVESLVKRGDITLEEAEQALADFQGKLQVALDETRAQTPVAVKAPRPPKPVGVLPHIATGVERPVLDRIFDHLTEYPDDFTIHPKLAKQFEARAKLYEEGEVEWATGEALAFGSLLLEGHSVRLAGEDSRRGTFSQRHAALVCNTSGQPWVPLDDLEGADGRFWVYDSLLSEYAALGFEYGYAQQNPDALVLWEAQFGDFINGAQVIIDQYLVAAEDKWNQHNGLVLLLPARLRGTGSRALLGPHGALPHPGRRGQHAGLQRHHGGAVLPPAAAPGAHGAAHAARRVHAEAGAAHEADAVADRRADHRLVRGDPRRSVRHRPANRSGASSSAPARWRGTRWPSGTSARRRSPWSGSSRSTRRRSTSWSPLLDRYPNARELVWLQEEPENMGAWNFVERRVWRIKERGYDLQPRRPGRVREPRHGVEDDPRPGARRPDGRDLRRSLTPPPRGFQRTRGVPSRRGRRKPSDA